ncbi:MAG: hypothetical protein KDA84_28810 [Planctomycetaceae bacterium]|nr:hypothetical protein [Planctomycetaceae bacterium]
MTRKSVIWMCAALMVTGIGFVTANTASAGWGQGSSYRTSGVRYQNYGNRGYGYQNYNYQPQRGYIQPGFSNRRGYGGGHYDYHDTTHFDYHPPTIIRHGNHFDVTPGHYDLHRSGHYDRH